MRVAEMIQKINKYLQMDDEFEIDVRFGLSVQCIWVMALTVVYGIFYTYIGIYELLLLMVYMCLSSSAMLAYCLKNGRQRNIVVCVGTSVQSALVHLLVTYYVGDAGTVFIVISTLLIPHLYPLLKTGHMLAMDIMLLITINAAFWIKLNVTPVYVGYVGETYRFILSNIGLTICMLQLYANIFSVNTLKSVRQRLLDNASKEAYLDALTGLGNRRMLSRHLVSLETDSDVAMSIAMIDIDFFKNINDTYGHAAGDMALVFLADTMKGFFRKSDLLIRWGGEEFLVIFRYTEIKNAEILMERFRKKIQESFVSIENGELNYTVTIGLTEHRFGTPMNDSIKMADALLYQGKSDGRNRVISKSH